MDNTDWLDGDDRPTKQLLSFDRLFFRHMAKKKGKHWRSSRAKMWKTIGDELWPKSGSLGIACLDVIYQTNILKSIKKAIDEPPSKFV
jgi:hypothetical protein